MSEETATSLWRFSGFGGIAVITGVFCCIGLKVVGGAVLFGGLAAAFGLSTDQTAFLVGGAGGLLLAGLVLAYRNSDSLEIG